MDALEYTKRLVAFESPSYLSNVAVTDYVEEALRSQGFVTERLEYDDAAGVRKATVIGKKGAGRGGVAYFGHSDVVPADDWSRTARDRHPTRLFPGRAAGPGAYAGATGTGACDCPA